MNGRRESSFLDSKRADSGRVVPIADERGKAGDSSAGKERESGKDDTNNSMQQQHDQLMLEALFQGLLRSAGLADDNSNDRAPAWAVGTDMSRSSSTGTVLFAPPATRRPSELPAIAGAGASNMSLASQPSVMEEATAWQTMEKVTGAKPTASMSALMEKALTAALVSRITERQKLRYENATPGQQLILAIIDNNYDKVLSLAEPIELRISNDLFMRQEEEIDTLVNCRDGTFGENAMAETPLILASRLGQYRTVKLLKSVPQLKVQLMDFEGTTALMAAAKAGHLTITKLLLDGKLGDPAPLYQRDQDGYTALIYAAERGHWDIVQLLVRAKADVVDATTFQETALCKAAANGHLAVVKFLLENTESVMLHPNRDGNTPMHLAAYYGHWPVLRYMFTWYKEPDLDYRNKRGERFDGVLPSERAVELHDASLPPNSPDRLLSRFRGMQEARRLLRLKLQSLSRALLKQKHDTDKAHGVTGGEENSLHSTNSRDPKSDRVQMLRARRESKTFGNLEDLDAGFASTENNYHAAESKAESALQRAEYLHKKGLGDLQRGELESALAYFNFAATTGKNYPKFTQAKLDCETLKSILDRKNIAVRDRINTNLAEIRYETGKSFQAANKPEEAKRWLVAAYATLKAVENPNPDTLREYEAAKLAAESELAARAKRKLLEKAARMQELEQSKAARLGAGRKQEVDDDGREGEQQPRGACRSDSNCVIQ